MTDAAQTRPVIAPWESVLSYGRPPDGEQLVHRQTVPPREPSVAAIPDDVDPGLRDALAHAGVDRLWSHQRAMWDSAAQGSVVVATGTASGKSLAFNLPVLDAIARDRSARALYLYPTKALAQDQAKALTRLSAPNARVAIYDGDTPAAERRQVRSWANMILTNPDMLHVGILPGHSAWADVLANLRFVIVDEAHAYRGVFGAHVANVLARLRRLAAAYGAQPRFLLASATIANPGAAARTLAGAEVQVIDEDGSPGAERDVCVWNPPLLDADLGIRASTLGEAATLMVGLVARGQRTIVFAKSRRGCELVHRYARQGLLLNKPELAGRIAPYRAGYTPEQRREIERRLTEGDLLGVVATSALELGVDIGLLDCAISVGFPGARASLRQQWGRAGRRGLGLGMLVAGEDQLDQYLARHPAELLERPAEAAVSNPANPAVLAGHLRCAAAELPLTDADREHFGDEGLELAETLPELVRMPAGLAYRGADHPAAGVSLRSSSPDTIAVVDESTGTLLGTVDGSRADSTVHEGAVYLHLGEQYLVRSLDHVARVALVTPFDADYYTQPIRLSSTSVVRERATRPVAGATLVFGDIEATERVTGYQRKRLEDHKPIDIVALEMPERRFPTEAVWFVPDDPPEGARLLGSLHAAEHAMIGLLPLLAICDRGDIGGLSTDLHPQTGAPTVFVYDGHPGGAGISERGYELFETWVKRTADLLAECPCDHGCPSCVQSPKCGNLNEPLDKAGALGLLRGLGEV
ncbi:MAG: box helicase protein [Gaiellales bacterium]|nr:box helicase protein [Gaiellales bacterium]